MSRLERLDDDATSNELALNDDHKIFMEPIDRRDDFIRRQMRAADRLSFRLLAVEDDEEAEDRVLRESLRLVSSSDGFLDDSDDEDDFNVSVTSAAETPRQARRRVMIMIVCSVCGVVGVIGTILTVGAVIGPPSQPVGPYTLTELQEGDNFFNYYSFYEGPDSVGSNGYLQYVGRPHATNRGILNVTYEGDALDAMYKDRSTRHRQTSVGTADLANSADAETKPFIYMGSAATNAGPRDSIRLEGSNRFNRGLFIIDIRHMPTGCGVWPAFWLTDEANWPVHGEIDIVESVNYLSTAKTALHSTKGCSMADIPLGTMTGGWDTAQGIPNAKTGVPDTALRYARDCFVYNPHQWLNQGCVAVDTDGESLGEPLNRNGGGIFALEWDPINRHIRSWVFTPHTAAPDNIVDAIRTAGLAEKDRVMPDPELWPLPYAYFAIGVGTDCPASHFRQMRLVFNTAFCGSVAGNRFHLDCPEQAKNFSTCNEWIQSNPDEMDEAYWKIRGVFVYQRAWEKTWLTM